MMAALPRSLLRLPPQVRLAAYSSASATSRLAVAQHASFTAHRSYATADPSPSSSVNASEVSHFNTLASSWWDPYGSSRLLHLMNPLRHDFIHKCLAIDPPSSDRKLRVLDIGCGGGIFAESAARRRDVGSVTAIDPTPEVIAVARRHQRQDPLLLQHGRLTYLNTAIEHLETPAEKQYDIISLFEVIEHIQQPSPFLHSILKHLKPGGWLVGSTIARTPVSWFTTKFVAEDLLRIVPRGTHDWSQYIQPQELKDWARKQEQLSTSDGVGWQVMGVVYVPGLGWKEVKGSESIGNYFFGMRKNSEVE